MCWSVLECSCNDLWVLDLNDMSWKKREVASGKKPLPRYGHGMFVLDDEHLLLVGGCGGQNMVSIVAARMTSYILLPVRDTH